MPIQTPTWRQSLAETSLPMLLSTVVHTAVIIGLAMIVNVEPATITSTIQASLATDQVASVEISDPTLFDTQLGEFGESSGPAITTSNLASLTTTSPVQLSVSESEIKLASFQPVTPMAEKVERLVVATKVSNTSKPPRKVHQVYFGKDTTAQSTLRFGGKRSPGARHIGFGPSSPLEVIVPGLDSLGSEVLSQASNLSLTGGAMMVSTASPSESLANAQITFEYNPAIPDGQRLNVIVGNNQRVTYAIYDWELVPLAKFVDSGHHGAISIHMLGGHEKVSLDAAFEHTLLGLRFIQADLMPRGIIMSQEYLPQDDEGIIVGPGELDRLSSDEEVAAAVRELKPLMARTRNGAPYSVLTDSKVPFVFDVDDDQLVVNGTPYFFFWEPANQKDQVIPKKGLNDALKKAWPQIKQANPLVIESMEMSFRTVALFRYQKSTSPQNWNAFMQQLSTVELPAVPTPSLLASQGN